MAGSAIDNLPVGAKAGSWLRSLLDSVDRGSILAQGQAAEAAQPVTTVAPAAPAERGWMSTPLYQMAPAYGREERLARRLDPRAMLEPHLQVYENAPAAPAAPVRAVQTPPPPDMEALPKVVYGDQPSGDARVDLVRQLRNSGLSFGMALDLLQASPPARAATASEFAGSRLLALAEGSLRQELDNPKATDQTRAAARDRYMTVLTNMSGGLDPIKLAIAQKMGLQ